MMACYSNRRVETANVITDRRQCCGAAETIAQEMYGRNPAAEILLRPCAGRCGHLDEFDARSRCRYWPHYAHPRWLSCQALHNTARCMR